MTDTVSTGGSTSDPTHASAPSLSLCTRLVNCAKDAIVLQDLQSKVLWMNRAAEQMFGWPLEEVRGLSGAAIAIGSQDMTGFWYDVQSSIFDRFVVARQKRRDGTEFWNQQTFSKVEPLHEDQEMMVLVSCRDITEQVRTENALRQTQKELQKAAYHDALTGLANRKMLQEYLTTPSVQNALLHNQIGVLHLDLDEFKQINDSLGHAAGDATLAHVADALRRSAGPQDLACRSGGDEFLLVCPKIASPDAIKARAELLLKEIRKPLQWQNQTLHINGSIGASLATKETVSGENLIHHADQALYAAKDRGRARIVLYTPELGKVQTTKTRLAREIQSAIETGQFSIALQPQMCLKTNTISGCEALLRWNHPEYGQLLPLQFLETARRGGILAELDYRAMNLSLDAFKKVRQAGYPNLTLSLNASAEIMVDGNYPGLLDWALQSRGLAASDVCIEIQETTILQPDRFDISATVDKLKRMGAHVALDDFGTGFAGFAHMSSIDLDTIKLDRTMIATLETERRTKSIVEALIRLSRDLGMTVIAEGVETRQQLEFLRAVGCPAIQGFGLARPMQVTDFLSWLGTLVPGACPFGQAVAKAS